MDKTILCVIRTSTERQETESQKKEMLEFCSNKGYSEGEIEWLEVSGASARKLNAKYLQMLETIKATILSSDSIRAVAFWHLNRLGRVESKIMEMKEWFLQNHIQVYVKNPFLTLLKEDGSTDSGAEIAWSVFATMVKFDTEEFFEKTRRGKERNKAQNKYNGGGVRMGFKVDSNQFIVPDVDGIDYKLVQLVFREFLTKKYSLSTLTVELRNRGIKNSKGALMNILSLHNILKEPSYKGVIIDNDSWEEVQRILESNKKNYRTPAKHRYFGIKIVKCWSCGHNYVVQSGVYRCWHYYAHKIHNTAPCTNKSSMKASILDGLLWRIAEMEHMEYLSNLQKEDVVVYEKELLVIQQKMSECSRQIELVSKKKLKIQEGYEDGIYSIEQRIAKFAKIDEETKGYKNKLVGYKEDVERLTNKIADLKSNEDYVERLTNIMMELGNLDNECEMYDIVHQHIKEAYITPTTYNGKNCMLVEIYLHRGIKQSFYYLYTLNKGERLRFIRSDGSLVPYSAYNIIREETNVKMQYSDGTPYIK